MSSCDVSASLQQRQRMLEDHIEEIDDSLEDLLIFPTQAGLKRSLQLMEDYFALERDVLVEQRRTRRISSSDHDDRQQPSLEDALVSRQSSILSIAQSELTNRKTISLSTSTPATCSTSQ